ncbi:MAG: O-antigen ligase family protein [Sphingorhabdus sp.]|nr:O-antigen ligase family protein [Sphingorhabdus sp.]
MSSVAASKKWGGNGLAAPSAQDGNAWLHAIGLIAAVPALLALVTWDYDGQMSGAWFALRHFSIPATMAELFVIFVALRSGLHLGLLWRALPNLAKAAAALWVLFALISVIFPADARAESAMAYSIFILLRFVMHGLFLAALVHLIDGAKGFYAEKWLQIITAGIIAYVAILAIFALTLPDPAQFPWTYRMPSATNIRQIANVIAIPAAAPTALILFGAASRRWAYTALLFVILLFLSWSGSRGALLALAAATCAALLLFRHMPPVKSLLSIIGAYCFAAAASLALPLPNGSFGLYRFAEKIADSADVSSGRIDIWRNTLTEIANSPWLGHGSGHFNGNMRAIYGFDFNHPHNFILQFAYDWGILGALAAALMLALLGVAIFKRSAGRANLAGFAAMASFLTLMAIGLIDGALFYPLTIMMAAATLAPIFAAYPPPSVTPESL